MEADPYLTAGQPYQQEREQPQIGFEGSEENKNEERLVLDKISLVFDIPVLMTGNIYSKHFYDRFYNILTGCEKEYKPNDNFEYNVQYAGIFVSWGRGRDDSKGTKMRLEFNPDKFEKEKLKPILQLIGAKRLKESRVTRLDVAIDYGADLDPLMFTDSSKRKHSVYWGKSTGAESVYLGSKKSDVLVRVYNKNLQQKECFDIATVESWWRVEAQIQIGYDFCSYIENPFKEMMYVKHMFLKGKRKKLIQLLAEYYVKREGIEALLSIAPAGSRNRIRGWFVEAKELRKPKEVFQQLFYVYWCMFKLELEKLCQ